MPTRALS